MAGGGGSTGGIGAQSPASGGFGGNMGGGYDGGNMLSNMGNNTRLGNNMSNMPGNYGLGNMASPPPQTYEGYLASRSPMQQNVQLTQDQWQQNQNRMQHIPQQQMQGGIEQDQEFRNFRSQHDDLSRQMNEYMQKAPMYQQLQELQGKMQGVQSRYAPQPQMQRPQQRGRYPNFNPMQQQLGGLAALLGGLGRR